MVRSKFVRSSFEGDSKMVLVCTNKQRTTFEQFSNKLLIIHWLNMRHLNAASALWSEVLWIKKLKFWAIFTQPSCGKRWRKWESEKLRIWENEKFGNVKQAAWRGHVTIQRPDGIVSYYAYFGAYDIGRISKGTVIGSGKLFFYSHNVVMTVNYIDHMKHLRKASNTNQ